MQFVQLTDVSTMADLLLYEQIGGNVANALAAGAAAVMISADPNRIALIFSGTQIGDWTFVGAGAGGRITAGAGTPVFLAGAQYAALIVLPVNVQNRGAVAGDFSIISLATKTTLPRVGANNVSAIPIASRALGTPVKIGGNWADGYAVGGGESPPLSYPLNPVRRQSLYPRLRRVSNPRRWRSYDLSRNYADSLDP